jgi:hypothetical protein
LSQIEDRAAIEREDRAREERIDRLLAEAREWLAKSEAITKRWEAEGILRPQK